MYSGKYQYSIEEKGRVFVPVKFRRGLSPEAEDSFVVTKGFDGCLVVYALDQWREFSKKLKALPLGNEKARRLVRWFSGNAEVVKLDSQGRIKIPQHLLEFASLDNEATIIGVLDRIEIWHPDKYSEKEKEFDPSTMGDFGGLEL